MFRKIVVAAFGVSLAYCAAPPKLTPAEGTSIEESELSWVQMAPRCAPHQGSLSGGGMDYHDDSDEPFTLAKQLDELPSKDTGKEPSVLQTDDSSGSNACESIFCCCCPTRSGPSPKVTKSRDDMDSKETPPVSVETEIVEPGYYYIQRNCLKNNKYDAKIVYLYEEQIVGDTYLVAICDDLRNPTGVNVRLPKNCLITILRRKFFFGNNGKVIPSGLREVDEGGIVPTTRHDLLVDCLYLNRDTNERVRVIGFDNVTYNEELVQVIRLKDGEAGLVQYKYLTPIRPYLV